MRPEAAFWSTLHRKRTIPGDVIRVENTTCPGSPDINSCWDGYDFWVELKVGQRHRLFELFKKSQMPWHLRRVSVGGRVFVLLKEKGGLMLLYKVCFALEKEDRYKIVFETKDHADLRERIIYEIVNHK